LCYQKMFIHDKIVEIKARKPSSLPIVQASTLNNIQNLQALVMGYFQ